jgi:hypothetical protein
MRPDNFYVDNKPKWVSTGMQIIPRRAIRLSSSVDLNAIPPRKIRVPRYKILHRVERKEKHVVERSLGSNQDKVKTRS